MFSGFVQGGFGLVWGFLAPVHKSWASLQSADIIPSILAIIKMSSYFPVHSVVPNLMYT